jgi:hypothetical protein
VVKLRWQRGDDGRWQARGIGGKTYVVEHCEHGFAAGVQPPPFNLPLPPPSQPLGTASTATQAQWLCERHHGR